MRGRRWIPVVLWTALIFTLGSIPNAQLPQVSGIDKAGHIMMYGVLGGLIGRAQSLNPRPYRAGWVAFVCVAVAAALDEWHQRLIPGRSAEVSDWLADLLGALAGWGISYLAHLRRETA